jgi:hypothetical protein
MQRPRSGAANNTVAVFHAPAPIPLVRGRVGRNVGMYLHLPL